MTYRISRLGDPDTQGRIDWLGKGWVKFKDFYLPRSPNSWMMTLRWLAYDSAKNSRAGMSFTKAIVPTSENGKNDRFDPKYRTPVSYTHLDVYKRQLVIMS